MRVKLAPMLVPGTDVVEPLVDVEAFKRSFQAKFVGNVAHGFGQLLDCIPELRHIRQHGPDVVPVLENQQQVVELRIVLVNLAEVVDKVDLVVQLYPVGLLVEPVLAEQVGSEDGGIPVGALVFLQVDERVDKVEQLRIGRNGFRITDNLEQALAGVAVMVRKALELGLEACREFLARGEYVLVDGVIGIDVGCLPAVTHPLVARFGQSLERVLVSNPVVRSQVPSFKIGRVVIEAHLDEVDEVG